MSNTAYEIRGIEYSDVPLKRGGLKQVLHAFPYYPCLRPVSSRMPHVLRLSANTNASFFTYHPLK